MPAATHRMSGAPIYNVWAQLRARCENPRATSYEFYGGRGIRVCARWASFESFYADMGDCPPGHSLDRIDVNGNYEPGNCRWATRIEQGRNTRSNRRVEIDGETRTLAEWAVHFGFGRATAIHRHDKLGWGWKDAFTVPSGARANRNSKSGVRNVSPNGKKWTAKRFVRGKGYCLGDFETIDGAIQAIKKFDSEMGLRATSKNQKVSPRDIFQARRDCNSEPQSKGTDTCRISIASPVS